MSSPTDADGSRGPIRESASRREAEHPRTDGPRVLPPQSRPLDALELHRDVLTVDGVVAATGEDPSKGAPTITECPTWLRAGAHAVDTDTGRAGVVQFLQSEDRQVRTDSIRQAKRARLRPLNSTRPGWWAEVGSLRWNMP